MALICRCGFVEISSYPVAARSIFCKYTTIFYQMQVNVLFFFKILLNTALICKQFAYPISLYVVKQRVSCCFFVNILVVINGSSVRKNKNFFDPFTLDGLTRDSDTIEVSRKPRACVQQLHHGAALEGDQLANPRMFGQEERHLAKDRSPIQFLGVNQGGHRSLGDLLALGDNIAAPLLAHISLDAASNSLSDAGRSSLQVELEAVVAPLGMSWVRSFDRTATARMRESAFSPTSSSKKPARRATAGESSVRTRSTSSSRLSRPDCRPRLMMATMSRSLGACQGMAKLSTTACATVATLPGKPSKSLVSAWATPARPGANKKRMVRSP